MKKRKPLKKIIAYLTLALVLILALVTVWAWAPDLDVETLKARYTNAESEFMALEGMEVHYRIEGRGDTLLLIHGTAASLHTWDDWTEILKSDFTIIRLDLPGFGLTGPDPQARYTLKEYAQFINRFMDKLGAKKYALAGNSLGGGIAWHVAALYPDQISNMILVDPNGLPKDEAVAFVFQLAQNPVSASLLKKLTPRYFIADNMKEVYYDDSKVSASLIDRYHDMTRRAGNRQAFVDRANITDQPDLSLFEQISCPTLIQWGRHDEWITVSDAELFKSYIKNSQVVIYENAGHVPMEEIPETTARDVRNFLLGR